MKTLLAFLAALAFTPVAQAQIQCWSVDGKRVCGDTPPPGAKVTTLKAPASPPPSAPAAGAKDAKKGPMTPKEQEADYRNRQAEAKKAADKAAQEKQDADDRKEACNGVREYLRTLDSGQRIPRTDANGERYYMDDQQIAQERAKAQQNYSQNCSG